MGLCPGGGGVLGRRAVSAGAGPRDPPPAPQRPADRGAEEPAPADHDDGPGGDPAQHPGGHGRGRGVCRVSGRGRADHVRRGAGPVAGHRHSELPGGGHHLSAPAGGGDGPEQSLRRGRAVRGGGAGGGGGDDLGRPGRVTRPALSAELCGRGDAVRGGGGADPGDVPGAALQRGNAVLRTGVQRDDGAGCGAGITAGFSFFLGRLMV